MVDGHLEWEDGAVSRYVECRTACGESHANL